MKLDFDNCKFGVLGYNFSQIGEYIPGFFFAMLCFPEAGISAAMNKRGLPIDECSWLTRVYSATRAIFALLGLGFLFLIPDLAVSIHRHFIADQTNPGTEMKPILGNKT